MRLLVYSENDSPRLRYVLTLLFDQILPCAYLLTNDEARYRQWFGARLHYGRARMLAREVFIPQSGLLWERGIRAITPELFHHEGLPALFGPVAAPNADFPFDLFATIFFLVSRYEEYLETARDEHERFPSRASLASRAGFLRRPLVDEWALALARRLREVYPGWRYAPKAFRYIPTYDIDMAWAYKYYPFWRRARGAAGDALRGRWASLRARMRAGRDPFDTYDMLEALHARGGLSPVFFFLLSDPGRFDPNISHRHPRLRTLIQSLSERYPVGIHPSYHSVERLGLLKKEIERLRDITGRAVSASRQHYLRLRFPDTYHALTREGISNDYTMGYADDIGFRASIATPFPWYNLAEERMTGLLVHPFQVMDVTLKKYLRLSPVESLQALEPVIAAVRAVDGVFCTLWHNSSFASEFGWGAWAPMYTELLTSFY